MGFVSLQEDIDERRNHDTACRGHGQMSPRPPNYVGEPSPPLLDAERTIRSRRKDLSSACRLLTAELTQARAGHAVLRARLRELEGALSDSQRIRENNIDLRKTLRRTEGELMKERAARRAAESELKELERRMSASPSGLQYLYDVYSTVADIDHFKPGERSR